MNSAWLDTQDEKIVHLMPIAYHYFLCCIRPQETCVLIHPRSKTAKVALTILRGLDDKPLTDKLAEEFIQWMADLAESSIKNDDHMKEVSVYLIKMKNRTLWVCRNCFSSELWSARHYLIESKLELTLPYDRTTRSDDYILHYYRIAD